MLPDEKSNDLGTRREKQAKLNMAHFRRFRIKEPRR